MPCMKPSHAQARRVAAAAVRLLLAVCGFTGVLVAGAAEPSFTASLDRDTITLGESVTLSLAFQEAAPQSAPQLPALPNFKIDYVGPSRQISIVNGQTTSSFTHSYTLTPQQPGDYVIPGFQIELNGRKLASQPLKLKAVKSGAPGADAEGLGKLAFVKLIVPKNEFYVGELFPVEVQLYVQDAQDVQMPQLQSQGFTIGKALNPEQKRVQLGNQVFTLVSFKWSLAAAKTGDLTLGPAECKLSLRIPARNRRRGDPFEAFGFDFFGPRYELRPATVKSEPQKLRIQPLPAGNVPPDFTGAVGRFNVTMTAGPTNLAVGDPITLKIKIAGRGTLDALALPSLDDWREFKVYPPTSKVETSDPLGLEGARTFEQVVIPQNAEVKELPALTFSFFDPEKKTYQTLAQPAVQLAVHPASAAPQQPTILAIAGPGTDTPPPAQDIVHIKTRPGTLGVISPPLVQQPWFLGLQATPLLAWLGAIVWRQRKENLANNPRLRRQRQAAQIIRRGLQELPRLAAANQSEAFFVTAFRLLQEQLGERLDLPAFAITEAVVEERLRPLGVAPETLDALHQLFQSCNQARYAPQRTSQELASLIPRLEAALRELQAMEAVA